MAVSSRHLEHGYAARPPPRSQEVNSRIGARQRMARTNTSGIRRLFRGFTVVGFPRARAIRLLAPGRTEFSLGTTGRSSGFASFRMRSIYKAERRSGSSKSMS